MIVKTWVWGPVALVISLVCLGSALWSISNTHKFDARAECVKMCEPRLVEEYSTELGTCRCGQVAIDLPGRCEATCLPRLVKSWDRTRGACECEPASTWGKGIYDDYATKPFVYPSNIPDAAAYPHPHTPETP